MLIVPLRSCTLITSDVDADTGELLAGVDLADGGIGDIEFFFSIANIIRTIKINVTVIKIIISYLVL
jgi:hypothetical protein